MSLNLDRTTWRRVRLGEVVARSKEQTTPSRGAIDRYVAGGHFDEGKLTVERSGDMDDGGMGSTFKYVFRPGHVLFVSASMYLRKIGVAQHTGVVADKTYVLESVPGAGLLQEFLPWVLLSDRFYEFSISQATGSMNARLLWSTMQQFEFDLPPLDEQQRIADLPLGH
jgi:type I restriction enzyme, S subunit